jgi:uncharacterized membrane protein YeiH
MVYDGPVHGRCSCLKANSVHYPAMAATGFPYNKDKLLYFVDLAGTFLFAIEGATAAVYGGLDLLGMLVLAFATALGGGTIRDVLIGDVPTASLRNWRYPATAFAGGLIVFGAHHVFQTLPPMILLVLDAAALSLFAVAGTEKTLDFGLHPLIAVMMGTLTAIGGGTIAALLLAQVPRVLNADFYGSAAIAGSVVLILCRKAGMPRGWAAFAGGVACFALRCCALAFHWNLPHVD